MDFPGTRGFCGAKDLLVVRVGGPDAEAEALGADDRDTAEPEGVCNEDDPGVSEGTAAT